MLTIHWCKLATLSRSAPRRHGGNELSSSSAPLWPTILQLKNCFVLIASCIAAYISFVSYGGYLVFGFRNFSEFCFIGVPLFAFPVALLGFRYSLTSASLSLAIMVLFFGVQLYLVGAPWSRVLHNDTQFYKFLAVTVLLAIAAGLERYAFGLSKHNSGSVL